MEKEQRNVWVMKSWAHPLQLVEMCRSSTPVGDAKEFIAEPEAMEQGGTTIQLDAAAEGGPGCLASLFKYIDALDASGKSAKR